jgi:hypothetical protein
MSHTGRSVSKLSSLTLPVALYQLFFELCSFLKNEDLNEMRGKLVRLERISV